MKKFLAAVMALSMTAGMGLSTLAQEDGDNPLTLGVSRTTALLSGTVEGTVDQPGENKSDKSTYKFQKNLGAYLKVEENSEGQHVSVISSLSNSLDEKVYEKAMSLTHTKGSLRYVVYDTLEINVANCGVYPESADQQPTHSANWLKKSGVWKAGDAGNLWELSGKDDCNYTLYMPMLYIDFADGNGGWTGDEIYTGITDSNDSKKNWERVLTYLKENKSKLKMTEAEQTSLNSAGSMDDLKVFYGKYFRFRPNEESTAYRLIYYKLPKQVGRGMTNISATDNIQHAIYYVEFTMDYQAPSFDTALAPNSKPSNTETILDEALDKIGNVTEKDEGVAKTIDNLINTHSENLDTIPQEKLKDLDSKYQRAADIKDNDIKAEADNNSPIKTIEIVTGGALNIPADATTKTLTVTIADAKTDETVTDDELAKQASLLNATLIGEPVQIDLTVKVSGSETTELRAPLTLRVAIPQNLLSYKNRLVILHKHGDDSIERIIPKVDGDDLIFTITKASTFALAAMKPNASVTPGTPSTSSGSRRSSSRDTVEPGPSATTPSRPAPVSVTTAKSRAASAASAALKGVKKGESVSVNVNFANVKEISPAAMKAVVDAVGQAASAKGATAAAVVQADTLNTATKHVSARLYLDAAAAAKSGVTIATGVEPRVSSLESFFARFFENRTRVIRFAQKGAFGQNVSVAVDVDLTGFDTDHLVFYSYDSAKNQYARLNTEYYIDVNGYLHFTTPTGNCVVVTDAPLARR